MLLRYQFTRDLSASEKSVGLEAILITKYLDGGRDVDGWRALVATAQEVVAHFPFHAAGIAAGGDGLVEDLRQYRVMKRFAVRRGKERRRMLVVTGAVGLYQINVRVPSSAEFYAVENGQPCGETGISGVTVSVDISGKPEYATICVAEPVPGGNK